MCQTKALVQYSLLASTVLIKNRLYWLRINLVVFLTCLLHLSVLPQISTSSTHCLHHPESGAAGAQQCFVTNWGQFTGSEGMFYEYKGFCRLARVKDCFNEKIKRKLMLIVPGEYMFISYPTSEKMFESSSCFFLNWLWE